MTAATDETVRGRRGDRERLCEPAMNAFAGVDFGGVMARERPDGPVIQQERRNRMLESGLESSEKPMVVVGERLSRKPRNKRIPANKVTKRKGSKP